MMARRILRTTFAKVFGILTSKVLVWVIVEVSSARIHDHEGDVAPHTKTKKGYEIKHYDFNPGGHKERDEGDVHAWCR
jgi:hypothetical protein